jgi:SnoaL-like domain
MAEGVSPLRAYLSCMDSGDFDAAVGLFAEHALYIRPPVPEPGEQLGKGLQRIDGRAAIRDFLMRRGKRNTHHQIDVETVVGQDCWAEGVATTDDSSDALFVAHATLDHAGLIARYAAMSGRLEVDRPKF